MNGYISLFINVVHFIMSKLQDFLRIFKFNFVVTLHTIDVIDLRKN